MWLCLWITGVWFAPAMFPHLWAQPTSQPTSNLGKIRPTSKPTSVPVLSRHTSKPTSVPTLSASTSRLQAVRTTEITERPKILIIGHRGAPGTLPEHTLESYRLAIQQGADYIEPDLVSTKDGVLIARHENDLTRTTDVATKFPQHQRTKIIDGRSITGWFSEDFTLAEIKTLRAKQTMPFRDQSHNGKYTIPTWEEILQLLTQHNKTAIRRVGVYPETKHPSYFRSIGLPLEDRLLQGLRTYGLDHKNAPVFIQSFEVSNLQYLRKRTSVRLIQLLLLPNMRPYDFVLRQDHRTYRDLMKPTGLRFVATYAHGIGAWKGLILEGDTKAQRLRVSALIRQAHAAGLMVHVYTFRNENRFLPLFFHNHPELEYHFFFRLGVDGIFTDYPLTAVQARQSYLRQPR